MLRVIEAHPASTSDYSRFDVVDVPVPADLPEIYCFVKYNDGKRIRKGQQDREAIRPDERYALQQERRWVTLGVSNKENTFPEVAYDGFVWCGIGSVNAESTIDEMEIPGHIPWDEEVICRVKLSRANDVYVGDHAAFVKRREELWAALEGSDRTSLTDAEVNQMEAARGATLVPITEYDGSYELPVVLIGRELGFDEVEIVRGPIKGWMKEHWEDDED